MITSLQAFLQNLVCTSLLSHVCVTSPILLIPLEFNLLMMCGKQNQWWSSALRNFVQLPDTTTLLGTKTLLTVLSRMSLLGNVYHVLLSLCHFLKGPGSMQSLLECFMYNSFLFMRSRNWSEKSTTPPAKSVSWVHFTADLSVKLPAHPRFELLKLIPYFTKTYTSSCLNRI
jgi:hypothetical protein